MIDRGLSLSLSERVGWLVRLIGRTCQLGWMGEIIVRMSAQIGRMSGRNGLHPVICLFSFVAFAHDHL